MSDIVVTLPAYSAFAGSVGSVYSAMDGGDRCLGSIAAELVLVEVSPVVIRSGYFSYSLLFQSETPLVKGQASYVLHHDQLGAFEIFLVPIQSATGNAEYEAVFTQAASEQPVSEDS